MIYVTKPFLPAREKYNEYIKGIWERNWLTNNGPLVNELEKRLKEYLGVQNILYTANGTISIQMAIKALALSGNVLTTPFSYIATTSSIVWESCIPKFIDICPEHLNMNPSLIEENIDENTTGIVATHCFGNPCQIEEIDRIAGKYNLKVIYDAAHCFGSKYRQQSIFEFGSISVASFHATKIMHSIEGGAIFSRDPELINKLRLIRNFGHDGPERFSALGINGKNSEFHAAMGLCVLEQIDDILKNRKSQYLQYVELLNGAVQFQKLNSEGESNYSYFPILLQTEEQALKVLKRLDSNGIMARRYFYPSLNSLYFINTKGNTPITDDISPRILCLPMYHDLTKEIQHKIVDLVLKSL